MGSSPSRSAARTGTCLEVQAGLRVGRSRGRPPFLPPPGSLLGPRWQWGERGWGKGEGKGGGQQKSSRRSEGGPGLPKACAGSWDSSFPVCSEEQGTPWLGQFTWGGNYLNLASWADGAGLGPKKNPSPRTESLLGLELGVRARSLGSWLLFLLPILGQSPRLSGPQSPDLFNRGLGPRI